jgi:hypothetical protein
MKWSYSSCRLWEKEVVERLSEGEIMLIGLEWIGGVNTVYWRRGGRGEMEWS